MQQNRALRNETHMRNRSVGKIYIKIYDFGMEMLEKFLSNKQELDYAKASQG